jgi:D-glycero-beta-D-manno-heptose-7-phosphate kinase
MKGSDLYIRGRFEGKKIAVIGDIVADQFLSGTIARVSREAPVFILKHNETETRPGAAANAAANVTALGGTAILVGTIGSDLPGEQLQAAIQTSGVGAEHIIRDQLRRTTMKVRVLAGHEYAPRQQVIRIDYESDSAISTKIEERILENALDAVAEADAVVISDYGCGATTVELIASVWSAAAERGIPVIGDSRFALSNFSGLTSATPNQEEAESILNKHFEPDDAERLRSQLDLDSILVTLGGKGMVLAEKGNAIFSIAAVGAEQPVDVTGAGDTVIAAYSLGLAAGMSAFEAATIANHAGGIVVMKRGTAVATVQELEQSVTASSQEDASVAAK